ATPTANRTPTHASGSTAIRSRRTARSRCGYDGRRGTGGQGADECQMLCSNDWRLTTLPSPVPLPPLGMAMGRLTTHVLDTAQGLPAAGIEIDLWRLDAAGERRVPLRVVRTNADGRTDGPLLEGEAFTVGTYELVFGVADYFARQPVTTSKPPFLD